MKTVINLFKNPLFYLLLILILGFYLRLYKLDNPIADWHSWRQADTAAVARNFYEEGYNPFFPKGEDMSLISEIKKEPNLNRYRFVEFPIYSSIVALAYFLNGAVDEELARLVSIIFSLGSMVFIYLIVKRYSSSAHALLSSLIFATLPFVIFFSRTTLPEPSLVFFCLGMFYFVDIWIYKNQRRDFFVAVIFTACAFLTKPMAVFYLLPLAYSYFQKEGFKFPPLRYWVFIVSALAPFVAWRWWMLNFPEGIPASSWLLNDKGIRLRPAFFKWIIGDRLDREILSITGGFLFLLGLLVKPFAKSNYLLHLLTASSFLYLVVFASGNVQHDYYQYIITPALCIFVARGFWILLKGVPMLLPRMLTIPLAIFLLMITYLLTWDQIKGLYQVNNWAIVRAGEAAQRLLPENAIVIAPYQGDSALLYQIDRPGFPFVVNGVDFMKLQYKVTHYVSPTKDPKTAWVMQKYKVLEETPEYIIVDLREINPDFKGINDPEPF